MKDIHEIARHKRHRRFTLRIKGSRERPRLVVHRSLKNLSLQCIDDAAGKTLFSLTTLDKEMKAQCVSAGNVLASAAFGELAARRIKEKGITKIILDRAGYLYHGRIKAFAEGLRKGGLDF